MLDNSPFLLESDSIKPSLEMGAFEALWTNGVSSFKQLREKLISSNTTSLSDLIDASTAKQYYDVAIKQLHAAGINDFGVRLDGTFDYPKKLYDADYPLALLYYQGNWDLVFSRGVSVVGTRNPTQEGIRRTRRLVAALVSAGFTIYVSSN
jgi:DNA processing protein